MTHRLIVTADDLGLTGGVVRAVRRAHRDGVVTSASLLAVGRAFPEAAEMVRQEDALDLGAHLAMVGEDPPLLTAREVPTLVDRRGAFPLSYRAVVRRGAAGRIDPADVRREFAAQLERVQGVGVPVTHLDTHQHVHLWPPIGAVVAELAYSTGVRAVRTPASASRSPVGLAVNALARRLRVRLGARGLATTDRYAGLDEAGGFDADRLAAALGRLSRACPDRPEAADAGPAAGSATGSGVSAEINVHPGEADDPDLARFGWGYRWGDELSMLVAPATRAAIDRAGFALGTFAELAR